MFRESAEFKRGRSGERIVAGLLMSEGWYVIPSYDYSGEDQDQPPKMERFGHKLVIPDLDVARSGTRRWAEVKTKGAATLRRVTGTLEHGISIRHRDHYMRVQEETGCKVYLFIVEEDTGEVLCAALDDLGRGREWRGKSRRGYYDMVYWPRASFKRWHGSRAA